MDALTCIFTRRSIRQYTGQSVTDDQLHSILRAGFSAPSANNTRPWRFIVVRDTVTLKAITEAHPYSKILPEAGCGILVCGDTQCNENLYYLAEDCSAAIQNMLLAAHALGLGAVWLGVHPREERVSAMRELMSIPGDILPVGMIAVGVPAEAKDAPDRYEEDKVHLERW